MKNEYIFFLINIFLLITGASGIVISILLYFRNKNKIIRTYFEALLSWTAVQIVLLLFYYFNEVLVIRNVLLNSVLNDLTFIFLLPFSYKLLILIHDIFRIKISRNGIIMFLTAIIFVAIPSSSIAYLFESMSSYMDVLGIIKGFIFYAFIYFIAFDINSHVASILNDDIRIIFKKVFILQMIFFPLMIFESILFFERTYPFGISIVMLFYAIVNFAWLHFVSRYLHLPEIKLISEENNYENFYAIYKITKREKDIVRLLLSGLSYEDIAKQLFITLETVKSHVNNIYRKSGVSSKIELSNLVQKCQNS